MATRVGQLLIEGWEIISANKIKERNKDRPNGYMLYFPTVSPSIIKNKKIFFLIKGDKILLVGEDE